jgi:hypothetical protein
MTAVSNFCQEEAFSRHDFLFHVNYKLPGDGQ